MRYATVLAFFILGVVAGTVCVAAGALVGSAAGSLTAGIVAGLLATTPFIWAFSKQLKEAAEADCYIERLAERERANSN